MTARDSTQRAAELSALLARHSSLPPAQIAAHVFHLQRIAKQLKTIGERGCNGIPVWNLRGVEEYRGLTAEEQERDEKRTKNLGRRALDIAKAITSSGNPETISDSDSPIKVVVGGDPRGPCLSLFIAGERGDGWGDGYAVY